MLYKREARDAAPAASAAGRLRRGIDGLYGSPMNRRLLVVLILSISSLMACATEPEEPESQPPQGVGEEFASRALTVCQSALEAKQAWSEFPSPDFNPTQPDPAAFPEVAAWLQNEVAPTFQAWLDGLTALGEPPTGREPWGDVLTAVEGIARLNAAQVAAAKTGDTEKFVQATNGLEDIQIELEHATEAAGVSSCADVHK